MEMKSMDSLIGISTDTMQAFKILCPERLDRACELTQAMRYTNPKLDPSYIEHYPTRHFGIHILEEYASARISAEFLYMESMLDAGDAEMLGLKQIHNVCTNCRQLVQAFSSKYNAHPGLVHSWDFALDFLDICHKSMTKNTYECGQTFPIHFESDKDIGEVVLIFSSLSWLNAQQHYRGCEELVRATGKAGYFASSNPDIPLLIASRACRIFEIDLIKQEMESSKHNKSKLRRLKSKLIYKSDMCYGRAENYWTPSQVLDEVISVNTFTASEVVKLYGPGCHCFPANMLDRFRFSVST